jgi:hypothetical protein
MIHAGDVVMLKPQWLAEGEAGIVFIAIEDEQDGMVQVEAQVDLPFKPIQIVETRMIVGY